MHRIFHALACAGALFALAGPVAAQHHAVGGGGNCRPASERTGELGCWIMADDPVGRLAQAQVSWHLDAYPTRAAAEAVKGPRGTVAEALGKVWLMTIADAVSVNVVVALAS